jgi:ParB-like chromosome segregation protein Spo0J
VALLLPISRHANTIKQNQIFIRTMSRHTAVIEFHPLANIFPLVEGAEFDELVADIREHGLHEPIVVYEDKILDGRNRYRACEAAGIEPTFTAYMGDDPVSYVVSLNLRRRHLNESQRAMVAAKLATLRDGQRADLVEGLPIGRASALLNVGERSVARAREVIDHGAPELVSAVERGAVSVSAAADVATQPTEDQREIVARGEREILRAAIQIRARKAAARRVKRDAKLIRLSNVDSPLPERRFPIVLADPPYHYDRRWAISREIEITIRR